MKFRHPGMLMFLLCLKFANAITPDVYWSMNKLVHNTTVQLPPDIGNPNVFTGVASQNDSVLVDGIIDKAIIIRRGFEFPEVRNSPNADCFKDPLECTGGLSFAVWANFLSVPSYGDSCILSTSWLCNHMVPGVVISVSSNAINAAIRPSIGVEYLANISFANVGFGTWSHIAVTWNKKDGMELFINGSTAETSSSIVNKKNNTALFAKLRFGYFVSYAKLKMDEVKIWYRKLSLTEVVQSMYHVNWTATTTEPETTSYQSRTNSTELTTTAIKPTGSNSYRYAILAGCIVAILVVLFILLLLWRRNQAKKRGFLAVPNERTTTSVMSDHSFSL
uniref:adhesion G-protein coupled receptor D1-like isoform X2 n=1 Tax=Ciona intestinalis TaxID=7719 RepID=UPI000EF4A1C1|nr:adhesion G-protein coupled receptor D1-like isoform X2 [Ciona intestinalis]|eukprot:XP_026693551.1 adhesion G-protein coupled receptor D1-like isoform X2 [Ciona intestinalis]